MLLRLGLNSNVAEYDLELVSSAFASQMLRL